MSGRALLLLIILSIAVTVAVAWFSDGRFWFVGLPLVFGLPLFGGRRGRRRRF